MSDRFAKRRVLLLTQSTMMLQAFVLAALVAAASTVLARGRARDHLRAGRAVDIPARQAFVTDLVGKADLPNAVALNSVISTALASWGRGGRLLIARFGVAMAFFLNASSFLASWPPSLAMRTDHPDPAGRVGLRAWADRGLTYAAGDADCRVSRSPCWSSCSLLVLNFNVFVPLVAHQVLHEGAHGFGLLMSALGAGAVAGAAGSTCSA